MRGATCQRHAPWSSGAAILTFLPDLIFFSACLLKPYYRESLCVFPSLCATRETAQRTSQVG